MKFPLNVIRAATDHFDTYLCALPGRRLTQRDKLVLLAHIMAVIREFSDGFRSSSTFLQSRVGYRQRSAPFARDLMDFVAPDMTMAEYLHGIDTVSGAWQEELARRWPRRREFARVMRASLFEHHDDRWRAYATQMCRQLPWFGADMRIVDII